MTAPELTRAEILAATPEQLRLRVAELMETKPDDVTIDFLRSSERDWCYSSHDVYSLGEHWKTDIGTSGDVRKGWFDPQWGKSIAVWVPAKDYPSDIGAADLVVSEMETRGYRVTVSAYPAQLTVKSCTMQKGRNRPFVATAETRSTAICRAALLAQKEQ